MFLILPSATVLVGAFQGAAGGFTLDNVRAILETGNLRHAYGQSIGSASSPPSLADCSAS